MTNCWPLIAIETRSTGAPDCASVAHSSTPSATSVASVSRNGPTVSVSCHSPHRHLAAPVAGGLYVPSAASLCPTTATAAMVTDVPPADGPPAGVMLSMSFAISVS